MWETWVRYLGWEDLLEKGTATHSSILAWRITWTNEPGGLQSMESQESDRLSNFHFFLLYQLYRLKGVPTKGEKIMSKYSKTGNLDEVLGSV